MHCPHIKREGESCPLNNNCKYPNCISVNKCEKLAQPEWEDMLKQTLNKPTPTGLREGEHFYNVLYRHYPIQAASLLHTDLDPFYKSYKEIDWDKLHGALVQ